MLYKAKLLSYQIFNWNYILLQVELKSNNPVKLDDDSDDDDALLQRCIQLGMPENSDKVVTGAEGFVKSRYSPLPINYNPGNVRFMFYQFFCFAL